MGIRVSKPKTSDDLPFQLQIEGGSEASYSSTPTTSNISNSDEELELNAIGKFLCEICVESRKVEHSLSIKGCNHFYCIRCIVSYVSSKLDDGVIRIACPVTGCGGVLDPDYCRFVIPKNLFNRWGNALCESVIDGSEKLYCPYQDCSLLMINDGGRRIGQSTCPNCKRLFCVQCKAPWHPEFNCSKYQELMKCGGNERLFAELSQMNRWRKCPKCKTVVEKTAGCSSMKCRCGKQFCYDCGYGWRMDHICPLRR